MTTREAVEFFKHFTYKPNWEFRPTRVDRLTDPYLYGAFHLEVIVNTKDVGNPNHDIKLRLGEVMAESMLATMDGEQFLKWIRSIIMNIEDHEAREWFRVDGNAPFDPHKGETIA